MNFEFSSSFNLKNLKKLEETLGKSAGVKVGILGSKNNRDGGEFGNAEIGILQEFGSVTNNIPPRSFLRMPLETKRKRLEEAFTGSAEDLANGDIKKVLQKVGFVAEEIIDDAFRTGGFGNWAPNAPATVAKKKSSRPLIDTAQLRRSITSKVVGV